MLQKTHHGQEVLPYGPTSEGEGIPRRVAPTARHKRGCVHSVHVTPERLLVPVLLTKARGEPGLPSAGRTNPWELRQAQHLSPDQDTLLTGVSRPSGWSWTWRLAQ